MVLSSPARWHSKVLHDTSPKRTQHFNIEVSSRFEIRSNIKFWLPVHMMRCRTVTVKWRYPVSISMGGSSRSVFFGGDCSGPQPNLTPNSSFSSEFGHFILKIRQSNFFYFWKLSLRGGANRRYFQNLWGSCPPVDPPMSISVIPSTGQGQCQVTKGHRNEKKNQTCNTLFVTLLHLGFKNRCHFTIWPHNAY